MLEHAARCGRACVVSRLLRFVLWEAFKASVGALIGAGLAVATAMEGVPNVVVFVAGNLGEWAIASLIDQVRPGLCPIKAQAAVVCTLWLYTTWSGEPLGERETELPNLPMGDHIADVSHFVRPGNAMDSEACMRGTTVTVYLVDQRIDMLPELLSFNLCSLRGEEERFAFSVLWELTPEADVVSRRFCKSITRSRAALTYQKAQDIILDKSHKSPVALGLLHLSKKLKAKRKSLEIRFNIDSETRDKIAVAPKKSVETTSMVEEFMLLANCTVVEHIYTEFPDRAVLRCHPVPPPSSYKPLITAAAYRGFQIVVDSGKALAESLDAAVVPGNPFFNIMLRMPMLQIFLDTKDVSKLALVEPKVPDFSVESVFEAPDSPTN